MNNLSNKVQLIGNLGQDPEVKTLDGGARLAKFSIATNEVYKNDKGDKIKDTQWHNCTAWDKMADIVGEYFKKGRRVAVSGKLTHRSYEDKAGEKKYFTEVRVKEVMMLDGKAAN